MKLFQLGQQWEKSTVIGIRDFLYGEYFPKNAGIIQQVLIEGKRGKLSWFSLTSKGNILKGGSGPRAGLSFPRGSSTFDGRSPEQKEDGTGDEYRLDPRGAKGKCNKKLGNRNGRRA